MEKEKSKIVVEEVFNSDNIESRKNVLEDIIYRMIKMELVVNV